MLLPEQIRAARGLLGWPARVLADRAGVHITTVQRIERTRGLLRGNIASIQKIRDAFETAGIEFLEPNSDNGGPGVRMTANGIRRG